MPRPKMASFFGHKCTFRHVMAECSGSVSRVPGAPYRILCLLAAKLVTSPWRESARQPIAISLHLALRERQGALAFGVRSAAC